ncbi:MAG TPA: efflux RND transporter periplasmic adaptor subunit [Acidobacteriota bacterium]|nr:efflux RND transporter periplasmic adaptor subunit [Acidobacteriota bacterium]
MNGKKWYIALAAVVLAALSYWLYSSIGASAASEEKDLLTVLRVDFPLVVTAPGVLEAGKSVSIGPPRIRNEHRFKLARMVEEGKQVSEGDFLMEFDGSDISRRMRDETTSFQRVQEEYQKKRSDFDIQIRDLKLQLEQAKSDYDKLENKLSRQAELESAITIAETKIRRDTARKKVELLERKLKALTESGRLDLQISLSNEKHYRRHMDNLLDAIDSLTVTAPVSGVVIYKRDWNNEPRQIGSNIFILDTVMELPDLSTLRAKVLVDEVDVGKVKVGQEAQITVDAVQGKVFKGKVTYLSAILKQATYDRPQKIAEALVQFDLGDSKNLRPGMSMRTQIQVGRYPQAIVIPLSSILEKQGRSFVQVWRPEKKSYEMREVQLLMNDELSAVVSAGLQVNEKIRSKPKV